MNWMTYTSYSRILRFQISDPSWRQHLVVACPIVEPASAPRSGRQHTVLEVLPEDAPIAQISLARETPRHDDEANRPSRQGQVRDAMSTVGQLRNRPASQTVITVIAPSWVAFSIMNPRGTRAGGLRAAA
jgi:hypothetical protein